MFEKYFKMFFLVKFCFLLGGGGLYHEVGEIFVFIEFYNVKAESRRNVRYANKTEILKTFSEL